MADRICDRRRCRRRLFAIDRAPAPRLPRAPDFELRTMPHRQSIWVTVRPARRFRHSGPRYRRDLFEGEGNASAARADYFEQPPLIADKALTLIPAKAGIHERRAARYLTGSGDSYDTVPTFADLLPCPEQSASCGNCIHFARKCASGHRPCYLRASSRTGTGRDGPRHPVAGAGAAMARDGRSARSCLPEPKARTSSSLALSATITVSAATIWSHLFDMANATHQTPRLQRSTAGADFDTVSITSARIRLLQPDWVWLVGSPSPR